MIEQKFKKIRRKIFFIIGIVCLFMLLLYLFVGVAFAGFFLTETIWDFTSEEETLILETFQIQDKNAKVKYLQVRKAFANNKYIVLCISNIDDMDVFLDANAIGGKWEKSFTKAEILKERIRDNRPIEWQDEYKRYRKIYPSWSLFPTYFLNTCKYKTDRAYISVHGGAFDNADEDSDYGVKVGHLYWNLSEKRK